MVSAGRSQIPSLGISDNTHRPRLGHFLMMPLAFLFVFFSIYYYHYCYCHLLKAYLIQVLTLSYGSLLQFAGYKLRNSTRLSRNTSLKLHIPCREYTYLSQINIFTHQRQYCARNMPNLLIKLPRRTEFLFIADINISSGMHCSIKVKSSR